MMELHFKPCSVHSGFILTFGKLHIALHVPVFSLTKISTSQYFKNFSRSMQLFFNIVFEFLATAIRKKNNKIKEIKIRKEEVKLSLLADDMTLYTENPKDTTKKLLELIN